MDKEISNKQETKNPTSTSSIPSKKEGVVSFATVTLVALIVSLSSLTIVSSRQSSLASAEADMNTLQEQITASIFLTLDANGSNEESTVKAIENTSSGGDIIEPEQIARLYSDLSRKIDSTKSQISNGLTQGNSSEKYYDHIEFLLDAYPFKVMSSDMLLGLLLISCGILGSVMSTMRDGESRVSKAIILGASVGFVALLGVKGGTTIFILSSTGANVPFNPYSTAFAGVVAGMFSEKLYLALSRLTDKAFGDDGSTNKSSNAGADGAGS